MNQYTCSVCGMGFKTKKEYEEHSSDVHRSQGDIACIACGFTSRNWKQMEEHEKIHIFAGM